MNIIELTADKYGLWDNFCLNSNDAWFWHTSAWLGYTVNFKPQLRTKSLSFFVYGQDRILACVPLTMESKELSGEIFNEFSFGGDAIPAPIYNNDLVADEVVTIQEYIFREIDRLARRNNIVRASFRQVPMARSFIDGPKQHNYLLKYGYVDISLNSQVIDLKKEEGALFNDLRRNHRRNIKKASALRTLIYTADNITREKYMAYKEMHHKAARRKTRPDITFEMMYDWLKQGCAFLAIVSLDDKQIGFEYYSVYKNNVYGFSAANDPDYEYLPIRHLLEWDATLWMKRQGYAYYEIGLQQYGTLPYDFPDKKQLDISHFKRGFGGFTVPFFIGEKYYSKEYWLRINESRDEKFLNNYEFTHDRKVDNSSNNEPQERDLLEGPIPTLSAVDLQAILVRIISENKEALGDIKRNPKAINYLIGRAKKQLGKKFSSSIVQKMLKEEIARGLPL
jgi:Acetyltransferase (GNAT) domain